MKSLKYISRAASVASALVVLSLIPSCSTVMQQGIIKQKQSSFDGVKTISMTPSQVAGTSLFAPGGTLLGAHWESSSPNQVFLILEDTGLYSVSSISSLEIKIDNSVYRYNMKNSTRHSFDAIGLDLYTKSRNGVNVPLSIVKRMLSAQHCMLRIQTSEGTYIQDFAKESVGMGIASAKYHMRKFIAKVDSSN